MENVIGEYNSTATINNNYLVEIQVQASDITQYWSKCGLIANFGSSYLSLNFPNFKNISNSVSFILNELLENAVKFSCSKEDVIKIHISMDQFHILVDVNNTIDKKQYDIFSRILWELQDSEHANSKYFEKLTMVSKDQNKSGIGLLSIINFFKGRIWARFLHGSDENQYEASIQVKINIEDLLK